MGKIREEVFEQLKFGGNIVYSSEIGEFKYDGKDVKVWEIIHDEWHVASYFAEDGEGEKIIGDRKDENCLYSTNFPPVEIKSISIAKIVEEVKGIYTKIKIGLENRKQFNRDMRFAIDDFFKGRIKPDEYVLTRKQSIETEKAKYAVFAAKPKNDKYKTCYFVANESKPITKIVGFPTEFSLKDPRLYREGKEYVIHEGGDVIAQIKSKITSKPTVYEQTRYVGNRYVQVVKPKKKKIMTINITTGDIEEVEYCEKK